MTLVELVVSMAITSMILAAGYGILDQMYRADNERELWDAPQRAAELRSSLTRMLGSARTELAGAPYPFMGTATPRSELHALVDSEPPHSARAALVLLYVDIDPATPEGGLMVNLLDPVDGTRRVIELDRSVAAMTIRYLWLLGGEHVWTTTYSSSSEPPRAIEITLLPRPGESLVRLLQLPILIPVGLQ